MMFARIVIGFALLVFSPGALSAQTVTAFRTGEKTTGMTKQCYYSFGATEYTRTIQAVQLCPLSISVSSSKPSQPQSSVSTPTSRPALTVFKSGERTTGMTKQCYYSGIFEYTKTVQAVELCPLTLQVAPK